MTMTTVLTLGGSSEAPRLSISIVIWILSSDTDTICQLNQFNTNSEVAMLSSEHQSSLTARHRQIACTYLLLVTVYR